MIEIALDITLRQKAFTLAVRDTASVEVLGLFGPSGSGKTSLLEAIAGLRTPDRGEIRIGGRTLFSSAERINLKARQRRIGYVPQDALLFPNLDVKGNITYGAHSADLTALIEILDLPTLLERRVALLSGGEKQRVALARALMTRPSILLLDEPLAGVDRERREVILPYILRIRRELHVPLIYVTHDRGELDSIADRVLLLDRGVSSVAVAKADAAKPHQLVESISPADAPTQRSPLL
ncbi:MAG: ATP-binding cassette domain-containing protein [Vicinamibacterales bacterium]